MISPRKNEVALVVELLTSDEYTSEEDMAKAIIKAVADVLAKRTTIGLRIGFPQTPELPGLAVGPIFDRRTADKMLTEAREAGLEARKCRLSGVDYLTPSEPLERLCECGHTVDMHPKAGKCLVLPSDECKGFTKKG